MKWFCAISLITRYHRFLNVMLHTTPSASFMKVERVWLPVAHNWDRYDQQHWDNNCRDDNCIQFHLVLPLIMHRANQPLAITKLNLWRKEKQQVRTLIIMYTKWGILGTTNVTSNFLLLSHYATLNHDRTRVHLITQFLNNSFLWV